MNKIIVFILLIGLFSFISAQTNKSKPITKPVIKRSTVVKKSTVAKKPIIKCSSRFIKRHKGFFCKRRVCCNGKTKKCKALKINCKQIKRRSFCRWSKLKGLNCKRRFCCNGKTKRCRFKGKRRCVRKVTKAVCKWRYYKVRKNELCKRLNCCKGRRCRYMGKRQCTTKPTKPIKKWSVIRKGLCRRRYVCKESKKTKKMKCSFSGPIFCKKPRKVIKPKTRCFFKEHPRQKKRI